jgi:hypothetical protein
MQIFLFNYHALYIYIYMLALHLDSVDISTKGGGAHTASINAKSTSLENDKR